MSQNGKGDKNRTSNHKQYSKNYDKIKWINPSGVLSSKKYKGE
tara:strand:+ start:79 stop:207 length:129 start_codon:yes stop_codon:yes gene_type:complete